MKRSILISLLAVLALPMMACGWYGTDNIYLFHVYDSEEFSERVDKVTRNNWLAYLGLQQDYYYFDADEIIKAARQKGDALMVSYVQNLEKYLKVCNDVRNDHWDYPTKEQLAQRNQTLRAIQTYALSKVKTKLRSQHALLYMRCNMVLGLNKDNITFWEQTASQYIETVYKDMMKNIYAGALYKTGRDAEASELFAEMGDYNSLMTQFYKRRSFQAIAAEYRRNPNAGVLPFLLQDFVNNSQEAVDDNMGGKLFIRDIKQDEALHMAQFAAEVVREGKTNNPAMWKAAQGWLEYLFGQKQKGYQDIQQALNLDGNDLSKMSARLIHMYIKSDVSPLNDQFDAWLAGELKWIKNIQQNRWFADGALTRTTNQILAEKYTKAGRLNTLIAFYNATAHFGYNSTLEECKVEEAEQFLDWTTTSASNPLDSYLKDNLALDQNQLNELIGTKHMRVAQWEKAIPWLEKVPLSQLADHTATIYAVNRSWTVEPWITRQWLKDDIEYSNEKQKLDYNYKLSFAREMLAMEKEAAIMKGDAQCQRYYDLAIRYAQAGISGDCWYLTHFSKSPTDLSVGKNEKDFAAIAKQLLMKASNAKDKALKEKALFGSCYFYLNDKSWFDLVYNPQTSQYDFIIFPESSQYKALQALEQFERENGNKPSAVVSNCDIYTTFLVRNK